VAALENGDFDRQHQKDSDCTSSGDRMQSQNSTESCKFPFSFPSPADTKSLLSVTPKSRDTRFDSSSTDEPDDKHKSFTRRKTAVLATDTASLLLLNPKKSRLHSIVVPNSFEHQFLANSQETKPPSRRVVPRQTSLAKIWDTVDSDDDDEGDGDGGDEGGEKDDGEQKKQRQRHEKQGSQLGKMEMKKNEDELEDEAYRRSIALCQEVSLENPSSAQLSSMMNSSTFDSSSTRVQNPMTSVGVGASLNREGRDEDGDGDVDNEEEEDEIRAIRIEEAIWNKLHSQPHRRTRKESFVQYVDRMLSSSTSSSLSRPLQTAATATGGPAAASGGSPHNHFTNPSNKNYPEGNSRDKSLSVFSAESEFDEIASESRLGTGRAMSTSSGISHWLRKSRGGSRQENTTNKMDSADPVDLEMGDIGFPRESLSYLSDCLYSQDDEQKATPVSHFPPLPFHPSS
jgi:hypothetical protein